MSQPTHGRGAPNERLINPATPYFFQWDSAEKTLKYSQKKEEKDDKGKDVYENIHVKLPFTFLVLDVLATAKGFNEPQEISYWANEVRDTTKDIMTVKSKRGVEGTGLWKELKEKMGNQGLDYVQSVYILWKDNKEYKIGNFQVKGASLKPWIEFCKSNDIYKCAAQINGFTNEKKGINKYTAPTFKMVKVSEETDKKAIEANIELQAYLSAYLSKNASTVAEASKASPEAPKTTETAKVVTNDTVVIEEVEDITFTDADEDDSLPF